MIEDVRNDFQRTMDAIGLRKDLQEAVFGGTMARVLGLEWELRGEGDACRVS